MLPIYLFINVYVLWKVISIDLVSCENKNRKLLYYVGAYFNRYIKEN